MAQASTSDLENIIGSTTVPYIEMELGLVTTRVTVELDDGKARIALTLGFPAAGVAERLGADVGRRLADEVGVMADVRVDWEVRAHAVQGNLAPLPEVRNIIAIASGKGGVGKSTTAANLALALQAEGSRVGVLDADIYGPSQPQMLGLADRQPVTKDGKTFEPLEAHGLQTMSIGFLVGQDQPVIWRGPMVTQALNQLMFQTNWRDLDYLIVDLPPGTGDTQLTLTSKVPVSGAIIVTTPQDIALLDARRGLKMFEKVNVRILGVIENMSTYVCTECGHEEHLFGSGGGRTLTEETGMELLGSLPLDVRIRREADAGEPTVRRDPDGSIALRYREIARRAAARLAAAPRDHKGAFPDIVVEDVS